MQSDAGKRNRERTGERSGAGGGLSALVEAVRADHDELQRMARRLRSLRSRLGERKAVVDEEARTLLEEFEAELVAHFAAEEAEEFFGGLTTDDPKLLRRIEAVQAEHQDMAEMLDEIVHFSEEEEPSPRELSQRIGRFLEWFDAHEHAENAVMREIVASDETKT